MRWERKSRVVSQRRVDRRRNWFPTFDPDEIGGTLGHPDIAPVMVVVYGQPGGLGSPIPAPSIPRPPDDHIAYAITWFGLAACSIALMVKLSMAQTVLAPGLDPGIPDQARP